MDESISKTKTRQFSLRPAQPDDEPFLYELYAGTRMEEISAFGWNAVQQEAFLRLQFTAQRGHYEMAYPDAEHTIILFEDHPVGRMLVHRSEQEILLVDIALNPEHRGLGVGSALITGLIDEGDKKALPVKLHVEKHNRAARLYDRLGFAVIADSGVYYEMEKVPSVKQQTGRT